MKKILSLAAVLLLTLAAGAQIQRPRLVVGLVIDQMRWDYLYYYYDEYGTDGLRRLLNGGFSYENTHINYAPTVTAIGHSSIYTGSVPALTGIAGNYFYQDDKSVYCCEDRTVRSVGSDSREGQMSPRRMLTSTIGDELQLATDFRSKVIGVALKDRAAILPAGHAADAAYWWDTSAGHFVTSTFYMDRLPQWVEDFNRKNHTEPKFNIKTSNLGVTMTFKMAEAILQNEKLGKGQETDMLTVSISSTDAIGHEYGTRGKENHDVYMQLDKDLSHFLKALDEQVGAGNYLLFLTADHGGAHNYNYMKDHRIPAGAWNYKASVDGLNTHLQAKFGISPVMDEDNYQFYLNDSAIVSAGLKKQDVIDEAVSWLKKDPQFLYVFDEEKLSETTMPQWIKERMENGYFRGRSGEIGVVTRPQFFGAKDSPTYRGTSHGQPFPYDTHIPFLLYGWNIRHGATNAETHIVDIAPTICARLHIEMPNGCVGTAR
ncbi:MAG: alkaline phosphatase family protein [Prevotella sp.]|nr:alkaline phosphatase family protein [Prevotella sp.]